jgi:hypothetical protein
MVLAFFLLAFTALAHKSSEFNTTIVPAASDDSETISTLIPEWLHQANDEDQAAWRHIANHEEIVRFCSLGGVFYPCWTTDEAQESSTERLAMDRHNLEIVLSIWEATPAGKKGLKCMREFGLGSLSQEEKLFRFNATIKKVNELNRDSRNATIFTPFALMNDSEFKKYVHDAMNFELPKNENAGRRLNAQHHEGLSICWGRFILYPCWKSGHAPFEMPALERDILEGILAGWEATPAGKKGLKYMHDIGLGNLSHEAKLLRFNASINKVAALTRVDPSATFPYFTPFVMMTDAELKKYVTNATALELESNEAVGWRLNTKHHEGINI